MSLTADLTGKRVLVTGASSGFGAHFAELLAKSGASVLLAARRLDRLETLRQAIGAYTDRVEAVCLDVSDAQSVREVIQRAGSLDVVINNAGVTISKGALEQTEEDWDSILNTNLKGAWLVATEAARLMKATGRPGSIINIASILGLRQSGHVSPYAISKAALLQLTKQLALELARYSIRVNALAPGYFGTELNQEFFASNAGQALIGRIPQRRLGILSDLDGPLLLLASDASRFMTGSVIAVDGGHLLSQL